MAKSKPRFYRQSSCLTDVSQWTKANIGWLAGLLEGEGAFVITGRKYPKFSISVRMTDEDVVRRALEIAGMGKINGPHFGQQSHHKPSWIWTVHRRHQLYALCVAIFQFMGIRRSNRIREFIETWKNSGKSHWRHGTRHGYEKGCRCQSCRDAHAKRFRQRRARVRDERMRREEPTTIFAPLGPLEEKYGK